MRRIFFFFIIIILFIGCASKRTVSKPYVIKGNRYIPKKNIFIGWQQRGIASWYGPNFHGKLTSSGERYNMYAYTAAHKTLPLQTILKVTNLENGKSVTVRVNDRGPFVKGRIIDLSYAAAKRIGMVKSGTAPVKIEVIGFRGKKYINRYFIQVGAFSKYEGAKITARKYRNLGYNTFIKRKNGLYKVFIKGFSTYVKTKRFKEIHNINGIIIGD